MVKMLAKHTLLGATVALVQGAFAIKASNVTCPGTFTPISASAFIANLNPGWNLGNTLDAVQNEGDWNNPPVVASTFDDVKAAGFKSVRLPVTWAYHFTSQSPSWNVDPAWLQRVSDVVDMITSRDFHTIVNVHHDSWVWADITQPNANITEIEERFYRLWYQIGTKLACKSELVAFEPVNEPPGSTAEHGAQQNKLNNIFLQAINDAGGFNSKRVVTLVGIGEDAVKTSQWFKRPDAKFKNPWGIQYHYYSPYDFIFGAWGKTIWGSEADKASLDSDISLIRSNFSDIPLLIGEWAASPVATETAARWKYFDFFLRTAAKYNTTTILWDNGADFLNRATHQWRDDVAINILQHAVSGRRGEKNSLPDSTTDANAPTQSSSATLYHRLGDPITNITLPFLLNGNKVRTAILTNHPNKALIARGDDFTISYSPETITFNQPFLSQVFAPNKTGSLGSLLLKFSGGADLKISIISYSTPVLGLTSTSLPASTPLSDLLIPVTWSGETRPAAVRAVKSDGGFLVDDWTQYLPELQKGRMTYGNQWDWNERGVVIKAAALEEVRRVGKETRFRIEFWPRVEGNWGEVVVRV